MSLRAYVGLGTFCILFGCLGTFLGETIIDGDFRLQKKHRAETQMVYMTPIPSPGISLPTLPDPSPDMPGPKTLPPLSTLEDQGR